MWLTGRDIEISLVRNQLIRLRGHDWVMDVTLPEATKRLAHLIRAVERGESVVIMRKGRPVALINPVGQVDPTPVQRRRRVVFGGMKDRVKLLPGWDDPVEVNALAAE